MAKRYPKSIMQSDIGTCFLCGSNRWIEVHHIFGGATRSKSTQYGLVVGLCHWCHNEPPNGVHFNRKRMDELRERAQVKFESIHGHDLFMREFHRNYVGTSQSKGTDIREMDTEIAKWTQGKR